jgi:hypothetical protein
MPDRERLRKHMLALMSDLERLRRNVPVTRERLEKDPDLRWVLFSVVTANTLYICAATITGRLGCWFCHGAKMLPVAMAAGCQSGGRLLFRFLLQANPSRRVCLQESLRMGKLVGGRLGERSMVNGQ